MFQKYEVRFKRQTDLTFISPPSPISGLRLDWRGSAQLLSRDKFLLIIPYTPFSLSLHFFLFKV
jgi:hypothetical protein